MSTTGPTRDTTTGTTDGAGGTDPARDAARAGGRTVPALVACAVFAAAGIAIWLVGLPDHPTVFDTPLSDLTVPLALLVALAGISGVFAITTAAPWRVVDIVVASVLG